MRSACDGVRIMPYAVPTATTGTETAITSYSDKGPQFMVAHNKGSGAYATSSYDTSCGPRGCKLQFVEWKEWGL